MDTRQLEQSLSERSGRSLKLKINDNRTTMLSVKWEPNGARVSLHRIFLDAPRNVMEDLACYLRKKEKALSPTIKAFIEENVKKLNYSHLLDKRRLSTQGNVYNLQHIYDNVNKEYFSKRLNLFITWFGNPKPFKKRSSVTFGQFCDNLRLIKINRLLDSPSIPNYLISYVVYHEMLHYDCPSYFDKKKGIHRIHSKEFKERELDFRYYKMAQDWIREHRMRLFPTMR